MVNLDSCLDVCKGKQNDQVESVEQTKYNQNKECTFFKHKHLKF